MMMVHLPPLPLVLLLLLLFTTPVKAFSSAGGVVVVGGGPGGLAAALEARRAFGPATPITLIERAESVRTFDAERAFLYLLDGRGQKWSDDHGLTEKFAARGVKGGDEYNVTVCKPYEPRSVASLTLIDKQRKAPYWIARDDCVAVLEDAVLEGGKNIEVLAGHELNALRRDGGSDGRLVLEASCLKTGARTVLRPDLVIGADGVVVVSGADLCVNALGVAQRQTTVGNLATYSDAAARSGGTSAHKRGCSAWSSFASWPSGSSARSSAAVPTRASAAAWSSPRPPPSGASPPCSSLFSP